MYSSGVEIRPSGVLLGRLSPVIDPKWWNHSGVRLYASRQEVEDEGAPAGPAGGALGGEQRCGPPCPLEKMGALDGSLEDLEEDLASGATGAGPRKDCLMKMRVSPNALPALPCLVLRWSRSSRLSHLEHPKNIQNKTKNTSP